jgi:hypothetical protein
MLATPVNAQQYVLNFDGTNDYVDLGSDAGDGLRTIELWFKPDVTYNSTLAQPVSLLVRNDATQNQEFGLYIGPSSWAGREGRLVFSRRVNGTLHNIVSDANSWSANTWYHVAAVIDPSGGMRLYVDCVLQADTDASTNPTGTATEITAIGRWGNAAIRHLDGSIDDVRLWSRALSLTEIEDKKCTALDPSMETDLETYLRMEEGTGTTTNDLTTNNYDGSIVGASWQLETVCGTGQNNFVLDFDGVDDYVDIGSDAGNGLRSIEFWFKPDVTYDNTLSGTIALITRNDATQNDEFGFYIGSSTWAGREGRVTFFRRDNGAIHEVVSNSNSWSANVWHHVAGVIDGTSGMRLYIDGALQTDTDASTNATGTATEITAFGRWGNANIRHFDGSMDEVRFWDRALSQTEIDTKKCNTLDPASETGLQGYWRFEEGTGTVALDQTTNNYDGTVNGAQWLQDPYCANLKNYVLTYDGSNDFVDLGTDAGDGLRTVEMWFMPERNYDSTITTPVSLVIRNDGTENAEFGLYIGPASWVGREGRLVFLRRDGGVMREVVSNSNSWTAGVWYHVAGVIDGTSGMRMYVDGVLQTDTDPSTAPTDTRTEITALGQWGNISIRFFTGFMDEVRFWSRALSQTEVQNKRCQILNPANETDLEGYWRFQEGSGTVAFDETANSYDGAVSGAIWVEDYYCTSNKKAPVYSGSTLGLAPTETVKLYPNPFSSSFTVEYPYKTGKRYTLLVYNSVGQLIREMTNTQTDQFVFDASGQSVGVYYYQLMENDQLLHSGKAVMH